MKKQNNDLLTESLKYKKSGKVLDLGAGVGEDSLFYSENGFDVTAIDNYIQNIHDINQLAKINNAVINAKFMDLREIDLKEKYDIILANYVFHHLNEKDAITLINKMKNFTKKHGINIITGFTIENLSKNHDFLFKNNELKEVYKEWKILYYKEYCSPIKPKLAIKPKSIVQIIVQKI